MGCTPHGDESPHAPLQWVASVVAPSIRISRQSRRLETPLSASSRYRWSATAGIGEVAQRVLEGMSDRSDRLRSSQGYSSCQSQGVAHAPSQRLARSDLGVRKVVRQPDRTLSSAWPDHIRLRGKVRPNQVRRLDSPAVVTVHPDSHRYDPRCAGSDLSGDAMEPGTGHQEQTDSQKNPARADGNPLVAESQPAKSQWRLWRNLEIGLPPQSGRGFSKQHEKSSPPRSIVITSSTSGTSRQ